MTSEPLDLRLVPPALAAWGATAWGVGWSTGRAVAGSFVILAVAVVASSIARRRDGPTSPPGRGRRRATVAVTVLVGAVALAAAGVRSGAAHAGPVPALARAGAQVEVIATIAGDPIRREGSYGDYVLVRASVTEVSGRGEVTQVRSPVLVIADVSWLDTEFADTVHARGRLQPAEGVDLAAVLVARGPTERRTAAGPVYAAIAQMRDGLTEAASVLPPAEASLVPALVDGDDSQMPPDVADEFRATGLTHLLAVSGANLTLMLGFVLVVARWCGVRARGLVVVGLVAVVFFVLLARPQPSVLRAAAMGLVALAGLSAGGRRRGLRALCAAVIGLLLIDPWLARAAGFVLSVVATAAIVVLAPPWRDRLAGWMPRPLAEAVAVPLAAQLACTPVVAAVSGQVSLVAVFSNVLVAPAVGPTTVLGLIGGMVALISEPVSHLVGYAAGLPAWWIVSVAAHGSALTTATVTWPADVLGVSMLAALCVGMGVGLHRLLAHRWSCLGAVLLLLLVVVQPVGRPGWPPDRWAIVMCDVGQGDALVLRADPDTAVVVDAGPDPTRVDGCLDRLGIDRVALIVLTHFHADHVDGLSGVLDGRDVEEIVVSPLADPAGAARQVEAQAAAAGLSLTVAVPGERRTVGSLSLQVLGPIDLPSTVGREPGDVANNASVVMVAQVGGLRVLLSGDAEPEEEADILAAYATPADAEPPDVVPELDVDVLKVAHHGSSHQDSAFVAATSPVVALVSVGADNDYGHPAGETLALLERLGSDVYRTDVDGDIALVEEEGTLTVQTSR